MMVHVDATEVEKESEVEAFAVQNESPASDLNQSDDNKGDVYDEIAEEVDEFVQKDDPQSPKTESTSMVAKPNIIRTLVSQFRQKHIISMSFSYKE